MIILVQKVGNICLELSIKVNKNNYIQCYVYDNIISPQGNSKSKKYAKEVIENYKKYYPKQPWKLYKLVEVKNGR